MTYTLALVLFFALRVCTMCVNIYRSLAVCLRIFRFVWRACICVGMHERAFWVCKIQLKTMNEDNSIRLCEQKINALIFLHSK